MSHYSRTAQAPHLIEMGFGAQATIFDEDSTLGDLDDFRAALPRRGLGRLPIPEPGFDPAYRFRPGVRAIGRKRPRWKHGFETVEAAFAEDIFRMHQLQHYEALLVEGEPEHALISQIASLGRDLEEAMRCAAVPLSFASSLFMRQLRRIVCGALLALVDGREDDFYVFTCVHREWETEPQEICEFDVLRMYSKLRTGIKTNERPQHRSGVLIAFPHSKYVSTTYGEHRNGRFFHHLHGLVSGEKVRALRALSKTDAFRGTPARRPIVLQKLRNADSQIPYLEKGFWGCQYDYIDQRSGKMRRTTGTRRIPGLPHIQSLCAMDGLNVDNACLLMGVRATSSGFRELQQRGRLEKARRSNLHDFKLVQRQRPFDRELGA